jgi:hypothetical protein
VSDGGGGGTHHSPLHTRQEEVKGPPPPSPDEGRKKKKKRLRQYGLSALFINAKIDTPPSPISKAVYVCVYMYLYIYEPFPQELFPLISSCKIRYGTDGLVNGSSTHKIKWNRFPSNYTFTPPPPPPPPRKKEKKKMHTYYTPLSPSMPVAERTLRPTALHRNLPSSPPLPSISVSWDLAARAEEL